MSDEITTCAVCPRLCRYACPVAVGTGREAATPTSLACVVVDVGRGAISTELAARAVTLCTDCGACQEACHLHQPLPHLLRESRARLTDAPAIAALPAVPAACTAVVIVADLDRCAGSDALLPSVPRLRTVDGLGVAAIEHAEFAAHAERIRGHFGDRALYTDDGGVFRVLLAAGLTPRWLHPESLPDNAVGSCICSRGGAPPLACCGANGPLAAHHPDAGTDVALAFARRLDPGAVLLDARCVAHLRRSGATVTYYGDATTGETS